MRASRLLSIQMLLETRGRMSAAALAGALEVSERTLYRDIDELTAAGVPVYAERGRGGGFQLLPGWKTSLTGFTPKEAEAVFLGGLAGPAAELGLEDQVRSAQLKLLAALPSAWRDQAQRVSGRLHLDPVDWYREAEPPRHLPTVATAVWDGRQLSMHYASWKRSARQVVQPLGLVLKAGIWYLVAVREKEPRTFRVSGIETAEVLPAPVRRPKAFDLAAYWDASVKRFERELYAGTADVAATARGLAHLRQLSALVARALRDAPSPEEGARVEITIPVEADDQAAAQLLRLAPDVEVLRPRALREAVLRRLETSAALYGRQVVQGG
ncbi:helix-turn-helix transcriptional regulator [Ramlibacter humi]|uniref:YafY family transcriptional regulator n=1 Tax=Ramlibacter humi TaxID=2530451 RepID=A0A4Z0CCQ2_9BURK|nr:YafY family protein [Ramlibacter humi]TFZ08864.1 YafY family transcriptional regulator [Ramlibacter humi]